MSGQKPWVYNPPRILSSINDNGRNSIYTTRLRIQRPFNSDRTVTSFLSLHFIISLLLEGISSDENNDSDVETDLSSDIQLEPKLTNDSYTLRCKEQWETIIASAHRDSGTLTTFSSEPGNRLTVINNFGPSYVRIVEEIGVATFKNGRNVVR